MLAALALAAKRPSGPTLPSAADLHLRHPHEFRQSRVRIHGYSLFAQTTICGLHRPGSSRLAARMKRSSGMPLFVENTGDPHVGQMPG
jgi:hypothetical protein